MISRNKVGKPDNKHRPKGAMMDQSTSIARQNAHGGKRQDTGTLRTVVKAGDPLETLNIQMPSANTAASGALGHLHFAADLLEREAGRIAIAALLMAVGYLLWRVDFPRSEGIVWISLMQLSRLIAGSGTRTATKSEPHT